MKTLITTIIILFAIVQGLRAQQVNWANAEKESKNNIHFNLGYDYGLTSEIGYSRYLNSSLPILLSTNFSMPMGENIADDFKYEIGGQIRFLNYGNFATSARVMANFKRYSTEMVRIANFGTEFSLLAGYYKPGWYVAGEFGIDKSIISNLKHKEVMKNNFPGINDGWYLPCGGNIFYGIQAGKSLKRNMELSLRFGILNAEKDHENALLPIYSQFGLSKKF